MTKNDHLDVNYLNSDSTTGRRKKGTESFPHRVTLARSATSHNDGYSSGLSSRPTFPTFLSSRSTRRSSRTESTIFDLPENSTLADSERLSFSVTSPIDVPFPKLSRKGTYSSLPSSPTGAVHLETHSRPTALDQSPQDFASLTLGIDIRSNDVLAEAIRRIASRRGSLASLQSTTDDRLRASSLPTEDALLDSQTGYLDPSAEYNDVTQANPEDVGDNDSVDAAEEDLASSGLHIVEIAEDSDENELYEDAYVSQDNSALDGSFLLSSDSPKEEVELAPQRMSWYDVLKEAVVEEEQHALEIQGKWERIANFLAIPAAIEKVTLFGALLCLDSFLYYFTILPIRTILAIVSTIRKSFLSRRLCSPGVPHLQSMLKMALLVIPTVVLLSTTDASKMYHGVRGQDTIKLYVIFNALEIADKLCSAFGQDILDTLFAAETLGGRPSPQPIKFKNERESKQERARQRRERARPFFFFVLALAYVHVHALVYFYQLVSLNVAVNSYDNALLTLLVSNQFVEIKGSVFKKFEKENLFQIMCADIVERFSLSLMLSLIAGRNLIEIMGSDISFYPRSFFKDKGVLRTILSPVLAVILSEMIVDWMKHGFITKFNHVKTTIYGRYMDVLCKDVMLAGTVPTQVSRRRSSRSKRQALLTDRSTLVTRRLGFAALPLACLVIRITAQAFGMILSTATQSVLESANRSTSASSFERWWRPVATGLVFFIGWTCLLALKSILGLNLLAFAYGRQQGMDAREEADRANDFGRKPIGDSKEEQLYADQVKGYLSKKDDNMPALDTHRRDDPTGKGTSKPKWRLEEVERWSMIKRIF